MNTIPNRRSKSLCLLLARLSDTRQHTKVVNEILVQTYAREKTSSGKGRGRGASINRAIKRNSELALQLIYTHLTEYLRTLLGEMYAKRPLEVVNKAKASLQYHEIVNLGSYEAICGYIVDQIFRTLEKCRNTRSLLDKFLDRTGVVLSPAKLDTALMYLEMRHLIVHNSSKVDRHFEEVYGNKLGLSEGNRLNTSLGTANKAIAAIKELCLEMDGHLIQGGYL